MNFLFLTPLVSIVFMCVLLLFIRPLCLNVSCPNSSRCRRPPPPLVPSPPLNSSCKDKIFISVVPALPEYTQDASSARRGDKREGSGGKAGGGEGGDEEEKTRRGDGGSFFTLQFLFHL